MLNLRSITYHKFSKSKTPTPKEIRLMGFTICFTSYPQLITMMEEIFIFQTYAFKSNTAAPIIIDCGSNIGLSILYFKMLYSESTIIAFEPDTDTFQLLTENVHNNQLRHVTLHNLALSSHSKEVALYRKIPGDLTTSIFKTHENDTTILSAKTCRLSDHIHDRVSLIKLDVEGSEAEIIEDLISTNQLQHVETLIIEFHPRLTGIHTRDLDQKIIANSFVHLRRIKMYHDDEVIVYQRQ